MTIIIFVGRQLHITDRNLIRFYEFCIWGFTFGMCYYGSRSTSKVDNDYFILRQKTESTTHDQDLYHTTEEEEDVNNNNSNCSSSGIISEYFDDLGLEDRHMTSHFMMIEQSKQNLLQEANLSTAVSSNSTWTFLFSSNSSVPLSSSERSTTHSSSRSGDEENKKDYLIVNNVDYIHRDYDSSLSSISLSWSSSEVQSQDSDDHQDFILS